MKSLLLTLLFTSSWIGAFAQAQGPKAPAEASQDEESATSEDDRQKYTKLMTMKDQSDSNWFKKNYSWNFGAGAAILLGNPNGASFGAKSSGLLLHAGVENYFTNDFGFGGYIEYQNQPSYFANNVSVVTLGVNPRYIIEQRFYVGAKGGLQFIFDGSNLTISGEFGPQVGFDIPINPIFTVGVETNLLFFSTIENVTVADWQTMAMIRWNVGP